jgi:UDP-GlcNAc:undecaprenyl-phosphate GlcNAc-1-phosphate transferase
MISVLLGQIGRPFTADEVLSPYIYVFYAAFVVSFILKTIMRSVAMYYGIIDEPDRIRKMHAVPVAYLGGVAVFLGWICGLAVSQFLRLHQVPLGWTTTHLVIKFSIVVGACCIVLLGLWDDILRLKPWVKIMGQVLAALILLADGIGTRLVEPVLVPVSHLLNNRFGLPMIPDWFIISISGLLVVFIVVFCCNATNLMDGLDGLCGGVTGVISAGLLFLAIHLAMAGSGLNTNWDGLRVVLGLALLGAVLGFVPYNFNPASIFMGDTGSMFLGFCCAVMIILMGQGQHPKWFMAATVMFALPVLDTLLAFTRRYVNGRPIFSADKHHIHHQLVARGFSVKQTVLISYGLAIFFALLGASIVYMRTRYVGAIYLVIFGSIIVAAYKMGMVHEKPRVVARRDLSTSEVVSTSVSIEQGSVLEIKEETTVVTTEESTWTTPPASSPMKIG